MPEAVAVSERKPSRWKVFLLKVEQAAGEALRTPEVMHSRMLDALREVAGGDLTFKALLEVVDTPEGEALGLIVQRMRALVTLTRAALDRSEGAVERVEAASERVSDLVARQRVTLDRSADDLSRINARLSELRALADDVGEAADRAALASLNAGIEGMRVGGEAARALTALGEEIRRLAQRSATGAADLGKALDDVSRTATQTSAGIDEARATAVALSSEATAAAVVAASARRAEGELRGVLRGYRMMDDETEALVTELSRSAEKLSREVSQARERLKEADPEAREAVEDALGALVRAVQKG